MGVARTGEERLTDSSRVSLRRRAQPRGPDRIDDWPPFTPKRVRCVASTNSRMLTACTSRKKMLHFRAS